MKPYNRKIRIEKKRILWKFKPRRQICGMELEEVKKSQDYRCAGCGIEEGTVIRAKKKRITIKLTQDHIVPFSRGGKTTRSNIQALCRRCNNQKGDTPPMPEDMAREIKRKLGKGKQDEQKAD